MAEQDDVRLSQYWDALVTGDPDAVDIDRSIAEPLRHVHTLFSAPKPGSARERARQRVFDSTTASSKENTMSATTLPIPFPSFGGVHPPDVDQQRPLFGKSSSRGRLALAGLAAALLIAALIGGYFAFLNGNSEHPAVIPAVTQESTPTSDVPMYRGNPARTGEMPGPGPDGEPVELWTFQTNGPINSAPAIVGTTLVFGSDDGNIYALQTSTGQELWRVETGAPASSSPAVADGIIYAGSGNGLLAIDLETGEEIWRLSSVLSAPVPVVADGVVYIGSDDAKLYALDAATGAEIWQSSLGAPASRSAAVADGVVYIGSQDGVLHAIAADTGAEVWTKETAAEIVFTTTISNGVVYQATQAAVNTFYALDATTGDELWRLEDAAGLRLSAVSGGTAYIASESGNLIAVDVATGAERWRFQTGAAIGAAPAVAGDSVFVCSRNGMCYAVNASSGEALWQLELDDSVEFGPVVSGGVAYTGTQAGTVYAIGGSESAGPVASPAEASDADAGETASPAAALDMSAIELVWETTSEESPLSEPQGIALDPAGNLYVADSGNNQILVFGPDGEFIESWGSPGQGPGQFQFRLGETWGGALDFDADGNIYVFDFMNHRIQKFDADRNFLMEWGTFGSENGQFRSPLGTVDDKGGLVYVGDLENNRVQVFDLDGNFLDKWGSFGTLDGQFEAPAFVHVGNNGEVYVGEAVGNRVQVFDASGTYLRTIGTPGAAPGELREVYQMAVDTDGNLFVSDYGNGRVQIFASDGTLIGVIDEIPGTEELVRPNGLVFDDEGNLYIADEHGARVLKLKLPPIE